MQLEDALQACAHDLKYASIAIQTDLDRFQRQKVADLRDMAISLAMTHRDWCKKVGLCNIRMELKLTEFYRTLRRGKRFRRS
jgi:hypothetical protein